MKNNTREELLDIIDSYRIMIERSKSPSATLSDIYSSVKFVLGKNDRLEEKYYEI